MKGSYTLVRPSTNEKGSIKENGSFAFDHGFERVRFVRSSAAAGHAIEQEFVYCVGDRSAFMLVRSVGSPAWVVEGIGTTPSDKARYNSVFGVYAKAHYSLRGTPLSQIVKGPSFVPTDAELIDQNGHEIMRVTAEFGSKVKEYFVIDFDVGMGWVVSSIDYRSDFSKGSRIDIKYGDIIDGFYTPELVTIRDAEGATVECHFSGWTFEPTPESEFNMEYFGLPDLATEARRSGRSLTFWFVTLAMTSLIAATILRVSLWRGAASKHT
ncbi:hypothetical protein [Tautonia sociabilis]|uniref:Uncharacterized protein n=1 Tax=Tautonia sociabilis TaxID=2080755 RepID=A0A432MPJ3_9BACT|nr:hypothetical protein [Tautonia sociabilis]RUL88948.1 hypothetical protein TsocGM_04960 [Tautonia sociabilis]